MLFLTSFFTHSVPSHNLTGTSSVALIHALAYVRSSAKLFYDCKDCCDLEEYFGSFLWFSKFFQMEYLI